jgi:twitching motility protein PilT
MAAADEKPDQPPGAEPKINILFRTVKLSEASDLHLKVGLPPMMRLKGVVQKMDVPPITEELMERLVDEILPSRSREEINESGMADFIHVIGNGECRFHVNTGMAQGHLGLVARRL